MQVHHAKYCGIGRARYTANGHVSVNCNMLKPERLSPVFAFISGMSYMGQ